MKGHEFTTGSNVAVGAEAHEPETFRAYSQTRGGDAYSCGLETGRIRAIKCIEAQTWLKREAREALKMALNEALRGPSDIEVISTHSTCGGSKT